MVRFNGEYVQWFSFGDVSVASKFHIPYCADCGKYRIALKKSRKLELYTQKVARDEQAMFTLKFNCSCLFLFVFIISVLSMLPG